MKRGDEKSLDNLHFGFYKMFNFMSVNTPSYYVALAVSSHSTKILQANE